MRDFLVLLFIIGWSLHTCAQTNDSNHLERHSVHAQTTVINQFKPAFSAPYTGDNSLITSRESRTSITATLFAGLRLWKGASVFVNPEIAGGAGLSQALGIAAATNGETFRVGDPAPQIYLARLFYRQLFALSASRQFQEDGDNQVAGFVPQRYLALTVGKIAISDYFDANTFSHDPRSQFMSWALMGNGAWDYPANTRGYTPSVVLEYISQKHEIRYGLSLMPKTANGNDLRWNIARAHAQTLEYTHRHTIGGLSGAVRLLIFYNKANMGSYRQSIAICPIDPVIEETRNFRHTKFGFGINAEQWLTKEFGCFVRASWNDGRNETWAFTEIDHSASVGLSLVGSKWKRPDDNLGVAYVISGISKNHRDYLKAGGKGFMLGDGHLNYAAEHLCEMYYSANIHDGQLFLSGAWQLLLNPGYNQDRQGPVQVFSVRLHVHI